MTESAPAPDPTSADDSSATGGGPRPGPTGRWRRVVPAVAGGLLGIVAALYAVAYLAVGDTLPARAEIAGVDVGGLGREEAIGKLQRELQPRATAPIPVAVGGANDRVLPDGAGLTIDHARSVDRASGGRGLDPRRLARALTGGGPSQVVVAVDEERLEAAVEDLARRVDREPVNGSLSYDGTTVRLKQSRVGITVQQQAAAAALIERSGRGAQARSRCSDIPRPNGRPRTSSRCATPPWRLPRPAIPARPL